MVPASVSVIIPTYNNGRFLPEAIESVFAQTVQPVEIIVVDDGSTDDTLERLRPYATRISYLYQANQGVSAARNLGLREASGDFIAFLDSDDVWHPRKLEVQLEVFGKRPDLGLLAAAGFQWPDSTFPHIRGEPESSLRLISWAQLVVKNRLVTSSVMIRTPILKCAGEFDTQMQSSEDRDLWLRVGKLSLIGNLTMPLTGYRDLPASLSKHAWKAQRGMLRILEKLDQQKAWGKSVLLRRKAYSYAYHACTCMHNNERSYLRSVINLAKSFMWYPLPYRRAEVQTAFERPKRLIVTMLRLGRMSGVQYLAVPKRKQLGGLGSLDRAGEGLVPTEVYGDA